MVTAEPAGANCANGGQRIDASVGDGPLTTEHVSNGNADEIACSATFQATDSDGDPLKVTYAWTRTPAGGAEQAVGGNDGPGNTSVIPVDITNVDDTFKCTATVSDGLATTSSAVASVRVGYPRSCKAILKAQPGAPSGDYAIDPDGAGGAAPLTVFCDMSTDGGGYTYFPVASGPTTCKRTDNDGCKSVGLNLAVPRTKAHFLAMVSKYGGSYFTIGPGVYGTSPGNDTNCAMKSGGCPKWYAIDGGQWWLRDTAYGEPNGDYTASCWLGLFRASVSSIDSGASFNDVPNCSTYCAGSYVCSTNDK